MINKVIVEGRLTNDVTYKVTTSNKKVATFSVALNRGKDRNGNDLGADFPMFVAWEGQAEFISKYFRKGDGIALEARIATRNYDDTDGKKVYVTEFIVERASFTEGKSAPVTEASVVEEKKDTYTPTFNISRDDLPF